MARLLVCCVSALLCACAAQPPIITRLPAPAVTAEVQRGTALAFSHSVWLPATAGFSSPGGKPQSNGQLILKDKSVLWGRYDGHGNSFKIVRRIRYEDIRMLALAERGEQRLIVVQGADLQHDSFAIVTPGSTADSAAATTQAYAALLAQLQLD